MTGTHPLDVQPSVIHAGSSLCSRILAVYTDTRSDALTADQVTRELASRGWLPPLMKVADVERELRRCLGPAPIDAD